MLATAKHHNISLISVSQTTINQEEVQTVNARDLHAFLEVGKDFSTWIKDRVEQYEFAEGEDFVCSPILGSNSRGGHNRKDYHITLSMAKELAMVERNQKGKQARQYFIECERRAKQPANQIDWNNHAQVAGLLAQSITRVQEQQAQIEAMQPKVEAYSRIAESSGSMCITNAAKSLGIRPKDLFGWMSANQWIYRRTGGAHWIAYQTSIQRGLLEHKVTTIQRGYGSDKSVEQVLVTAKGLAKLAELVPNKPQLVA